MCRKSKPITGSCWRQAVIAIRQVQGHDNCIGKPINAACWHCKCSNNLKGERKQCLKAICSACEEGKAFKAQHILKSCSGRVWISLQAHWEGFLLSPMSLSLREGGAHGFAHCTATRINNRTGIQHIPARNYLQTTVIHQVQPRKNCINMQQTSWGQKDKESGGRKTNCMKAA